ncbi:cupin domain-containing protein [Pelagibacterium xiamenense]|uniref:cupin domain-containing protein n=1 Tax=Pelagibacterium xiamenense TaxID=2901140 RepID=UPI001E631461|nr:cupin domain-containing protein [Pelagibacterium xiamenense]MCD7059173.1 cupin domain-containing protein [Pelagibacterium xiamenense]
MPHILRAADRDPNASRTITFEGDRFGANISFFAVDSGPGAHVGLHVHPYTEIWIVKSGSVRFTAAGESHEAGPNDIFIVEPETPHGFTNIGDDRLEMVCIHDSGTIIQTFLGEGDA